MIWRKEGMKMRIKGFSLGVSIFCFIFMIQMFMINFPIFAIIDGIFGILNMYVAFPNN